MEFKQKAEEKKMSMSKNIARLAVTAGLTAALSFGGVMAPVTMAFAAESDNTITIKQVDKNATTTFKAYQIFKADVVDESGKPDKVVSNVKWAFDDESVQAAIIGAINGRYPNALKSDAKAPDVADWLTANVKDTTKETRVDKDSVLNDIAKVVKNKVEPTGDSFEAGFPFEPKNAADNTPNTGYYLFLTDDAGIGQKTENKKNTGTSPIFAVVGGSAVEVTEKTSIPTVEKKIRDDKPYSDWADKADSQMGQDVHYRLTGTVADNIATFDTYYYEFNDVLSAGLTANVGTIEVKIGDKTLLRNATEGDKTGYDVSTDDATNTLTVKFTDLKTAANKVGAMLDGRSNVVVTYTAKLDHEKVDKVTVGGEGNPNSVKLIYSNNPMSNGKGESVSDTVRDYTYALKLVKEDAADETTKLDGVKFTIQATGADEGDGTQFVQKDGSLGSTAHEFATDAKGEINIKGLDAGTYTVKETHTLDGYNTLPGFTFTIATDEGDLGKTEEQGTTLTVNASKDGSNLVLTPSFDKGTVTLTVQNKKGSGLPLTGLNGVTFTWIAGGAVLVIGVAHLIRSRKQAEESEQE